MLTVKLSGFARQNVGKRDAKDLRNEGNVPCVMYGAGVPQKQFWANAYDIQQILFSPDVFKVIITVDGQTFETVVQESQFHPVSDLILHVDFLILQADKIVKIALPLNFTGVSPGVKVGGKFVQRVRKLKIQALPAHIPARLDVDISTLELGKSICVRELNYPNVKILESPSNPVCIVSVPRGLK